MCVTPDEGNSRENLGRMVGILTVLTTFPDLLIMVTVSVIGAIFERMIWVYFLREKEKTGFLFFGMWYRKEDLEKK